MDARIAWRPRDAFQWELIGRNLSNNHLEFNDMGFSTVGTLVQAEIYTVLTWMR
jgi:hypothetical protein